MHLSHHNAKNCSQYLLRNYSWVSNIKREIFSNPEQITIFLKCGTLLLEGKNKTKQKNPERNIKEE